jgi:hypothetical protein
MSLITQDGFALVGAAEHVDAISVRWDDVTLKR